jgi:small conductance mechanosensitive channel
LFWKRNPLQASEAKKRTHTSGDTLCHALLLVISFIALLMIPGEPGTKLRALLAMTGIGGFAIGFGAQSLIKDVISGFFIIFENRHRIGLDS